jgi:hypothetical protein
MLERCTFSHLGDVQAFCPDPSEYRFVAIETMGKIIRFATGMDTVAFKLPALLKEAAIKSGGDELSNVEIGWFAFTLFRIDRPEPDLEFWATKAYIAARE